MFPCRSHALSRLLFSFSQSSTFASFSERPAVSHRLLSTSTRRNMPAEVWHQLSQAYPPKPSFTEESIPALDGKVYVVTGANTGLGKEIARILYTKHATVIATARSRQKADQAMDDIKKAAPGSAGQLVFLLLDLADLGTIKASAQQILGRTNKIHVLFNNAGVMLPDEGEKTAQGYDLQLGVNNIGTHLFTKLLTPTLVKTARDELPGTVRVVWASSSAAETPFVPKGGVPMDNLDYHKKTSNFARYAISKAGNYLQGAEFARRYGNDGVVSIALNPGNLNSDLWRTQGAIMSTLLRSLVLHPVIYGAYTQLFAGLSPEVTGPRPGEWVVPWGRFMKVRKDLKAAAAIREEGGTGVARDFWDWMDEQVRTYE